MTLDTTFLRFIAILLITNSHLDGLYPYVALSTGGQLGNSLFFMLSGFGLVSSYLRKGDSFPSWLKRRLSRIYPPVLLVTLVGAVATGAIVAWGSDDYFQRLLWPTEYWFVAAIVMFYIPFYWLMRLGNARIFMLAIALLVVPYFYFYTTSMDLTRFSVEDQGYFKWLFYLQVMLLGGYLAFPENSVRLPQPDVGNAVLLGVFLLAYLGVKFAISKGLIVEYQFLVHGLTFPIMVLALRTMDTQFVKETVKNWPIWPLVAMVAGATLEIYLLQKYIYGHPWIVSLAFPFNVTVFWPVVIAGGILTAWLSTRLVNVLARPSAVASRVG